MSGHAFLNINVPTGLKERYARRAKELGFSLTGLTVALMHYAVNTKDLRIEITGTDPDLVDPIQREIERAVRKEKQAKKTAQRAK